MRRTWFAWVLFLCFGVAASAPTPTLGRAVGLVAGSAPLSAGQELATTTWPWTRSGSPDNPRPIRRKLILLGQRHIQPGIGRGFPHRRGASGSTQGKHDRRGGIDPSLRRFPQSGARVDRRSLFGLGLPAGVPAHRRVDVRPLAGSRSAWSQVPWTGTGSGGRLAGGRRPRCAGDHRSDLLAWRPRARRRVSLPRPDLGQVRAPDPRRVA